MNLISSVLISFQTITKDLENREKQTAKLINELKGMTDKCEDSDRHKNHLMVQVEDTAGKLRDTSRELDKALTELRNTQLALADAEKKRDEFKGRAQETVRQWVFSLCLFFFCIENISWILNIFK